MPDPAKFTDADNAKLAEANIGDFCMHCEIVQTVAALGDHFQRQGVDDEKISTGLLTGIIHVFCHTLAGVKEPEKRQGWIDRLRDEAPQLIELFERVDAHNREMMEQERERGMLANARPAGNA